MPLSGAHGVVWDHARSVLWALGNRELLKLEVLSGDPPAADVVQRWNLPQRGGHDLVPLDERHLVVTVGNWVYRFDAEDESFSPKLARLPRVKSVSRHPATGAILYTQGEPFTNTIHVAGKQPIVLPPNNLYKVRWNAHNHFSYPR